MGIAGMKNPYELSATSLAALSNLNIKIFADGADKAQMLRAASLPYIRGFTTNLAWMSQAGIRDYEAFARDITTCLPYVPISFEVFADDFEAMRRQALKIASWGENIYIKIPVMNTQAEASYDLLAKLAKEGIKQNVTAVMTIQQVQSIRDALGNEVPSFVSIFAGRIADTGVDPMPIMREATSLLLPNQQLIWASPREVLNIFQADAVNCPIITLTHDIIEKLNHLHKDLTVFSRETVQMLFDKAQESGLWLKI